MDSIPVGLCSLSEWLQLGAAVAPAQETQERTPVQENSPSSSSSNGLWSTVAADADTNAMTFLYMIMCKTDHLYMPCIFMHDHV